MSWKTIDLFASKLTKKVVAALSLPISNVTTFMSLYNQPTGSTVALKQPGWSSEQHPAHSQRSKGATLLLLNLSTAFDTIDHWILLHTIQHKVGITGECLRWIVCYLRDRSQAVCISGKQWKDTLLTCCVPQGSVLGPLLFSTYTFPLARIIRNLGLSYPVWWWYTTLHIEPCRDNNSSQTAHIRRVEQCVTAIREWMWYNMLLLNEDKTELFSFHVPVLTLLNSLMVWYSSISHSKTARNAGCDFWYQHVPQKAYYRHVTSCLLPPAMCHWSYPKIPWSSEPLAACTCTCDIMSR